MGRETLTPDDHEIPAPVQHHRASSRDGDVADSSPAVEVTTLREGRTYIAPGGVQITVDSLQVGTPPTVRLVLRDEDDERVAEFRANYAEGVAFGIRYKVDIDGDELTLRVEPTEITGPIDVTSAGEIAKKDFAERLQCEGDRMQVLGNTNGTVTIEVIKGQETVVCATTVGLYTRSIIE